MPATLTKRKTYTLPELKAQYGDARVAPWTETPYEEALRRLRDHVTEGEWWSSTYEVWKETLEDEGFRDADICFTGFWSQGDGASFTARVDVERYLAATRSMDHYPEYTKRLILEQMQEIICDSHADLAFSIIRCSGHYVHSNMMELTDNSSILQCEAWSWGFDGEECQCGVDWNALDQDVERMRTDILTHAKRRADEIYRALEEEYDHLTNEESLLEYAEANDYRFYADGVPL